MINNQKNTILFSLIACKGHGDIIKKHCAAKAQCFLEIVTILQYVLQCNQAYYEFEALYQVQF